MYIDLDYCILRDTDNAYIPKHEGNRDYKEYLDWVAAGNPPAQPPVIPLEDAQASQTAQISRDCSAAIYAGFQSSALGSVYDYPFKQLDQQNLSDSVLASMLPTNPPEWQTPFWCADQADPPVWAMRMHTAAQIQQVGQDAMERKLACMAQNDALAAQIAAATTVAAVQAIVWVDPAAAT